MAADADDAADRAIARSAFLGPQPRHRFIMSNKRGLHAKGRIQGPWTPLRWELLDSAAWKELSFGARSLYIALLRRLSHAHYNNGNVFLSTRHAAKELGASQEAVCRWFHELQHYGFIVMTSPGHLGVEGKGKAPHWRLTDMGWGVNVEPTKDYLKWDGVLFQAARKTESRPKKPLRVTNKTAHTPDQQNRSGPPESDQQNRSYEQGGLN